MTSQSKHDHVSGVHAVAACIAHEPELILRLHVAARQRDDRLRELLAEAQRLGLAVEKHGVAELDKMAPGGRHQGVLAVCKKAPAIAESTMQAQLAELPHPGFVLALDGVTDPHNLGAVLRTASAAGVDCVIAPKAGCVGLTPAVRRVASGAASSVPFCQVSNLVRTLQQLQIAGFWIYGAADASSAQYTTADYRQPTVLVLGAEDKGMRRLTREACDQLIAIPMAGSVSSLNVSVAAGVLMYEVTRQRALPSG